MGTQIGTDYYRQIANGYDTITYSGVSGISVQTVGHTAIAEEGEHRDSDGTTDNHSIDDPGAEISVTGHMKSTNGSLVAPAAGTIVTVNSVKYIALAGAQIVQTVGSGDAAIAVITMTLRRRDSLGTAIDAL